MNGRPKAPKALICIPVALVLAVTLSCGPSNTEIDSRIATAVAGIPTATPQPTATPALMPTSLPTPTPPSIPSLKEIDARIATAVAGIPTATPQPFPTPVPTATPQPTPTPATIPSLQEIDTRIGRAIAAIPPPTPMPTPTPQPTPTPMPTATPMPTPTPIPLPVLVAITSPASGPGSAPVTGTITLRMDPGRPMAGRNIAFSIEGLTPWQDFTASFLDPQSSPAQWITDNELLLTSGGSPAFERRLFADADGKATWSRIATKDVEGTWKVALTIGGAKYPVTYTVSQLQLQATSVNALGLDFRKYEGSVTDSYASALVQSSLALDLQSHLLAVVDRMRTRLGYQSGQIPDIYLLGNRSLLETAAKNAGVALIGWEAGFHKGTGASQGIYMQTDYLATALTQIMTHEYVHLLLDEVAPKATLPAWVNEGTARYYELTLGLELQGQHVTRRDTFTQADSVVTAAKAGTLLALTALESQAAWNRETDRQRVSLQYAEAYMAVKYYIERFGEKGLVNLLGLLNDGNSLSAAVQFAAGVSYEKFQTDFVAWVKAWQDQGREAMRTYVSGVGGILGDWAALSDQRAKQISSEGSIPLSARIPSRQSFLTQAQNLQSRAKALSAPASASAFQAELDGVLQRVVVWLQLELEYVQTGNDAKRVQANNMLQELWARQNGVYRSLYDLQVEYNLQ